MKASLLLLLMAVSGSASAIQEVNLRLDDGDAAEAGQDPASFTVTRTDDGNLAQGITAHVAVEGNASIGADYSYPGMNWIGGNQFWISIPGNQSFTTITLTPVLDNIIEDTEDAIITLLDKGSEYTVGADTQAEFSITDDVAEVTLTLDDGSAAEAGQDPASFTVTRTTNGNFGQGITAHVAVEGNASIGADYSYPGMNWIGGNQFWISIPGNQSFTTITLTPVLDNIIEDTEDAIITLLDKGSEYTVGADTQAEFSITDDVAEVTLTLDDGSAAEAGQDPASFTVTRTTNGNFGQGITAHVAVEGNASIGADYSYPGMNWIGGNQFWISIPGNQSFTTITLTPVLDNIIEDTEDAIITLLDKGSEYTVGADTQAEFSITDDVAEVTLTLDDGSAAEAGQDPASFTVTRTTNGNFGQGITAHVAVEGTATIGTDYSYPGMNWIGGNQFWISIPANQSSTKITLTPVVDNLEEEGDETIIVTLLDKAAEYTVGEPSIVSMTILDFQQIIFRDSFEE